MKVTTAIISRSEKIDKRVSNSINFADEIVMVVDSTPQKPQTIGKIHRYYRPLAADYASQRNFALKNACHDWVLFIDNDEYVGTELAREIQELDPKTNDLGYLIRRTDVCFHQPLLHGETGKVKLLRLGKRTAGKFTRPVHETWKMAGGVGELRSTLYHIKDNFISGFIDRMSHYGQIDAEALLKENKPFSLFRLFFNPKAKFMQNYFGKLGFLDGTIGLFMAYLMSVQSLTVRVFQWTKRS